jgi:two-component system, LuxR family, sensor kinase FixL
MKATTQLLLVDDDAAILQIYSELLRAEGYEVWQASTGQEGLRAARERRPNVVLLDVMLPDLNGVEVCRQIKADPALPDTFVVLFSSLATSVADKVEGLQSGADDYLVKSLQVDEFFARIRTIIRLQEATAALRASEQHHRELAAIVENSEDAIYSRTLEGAILSWNRAAERIYGYAAEELIGRPVTALLAPGYDEQLQGILQAPGCGSKVVNYETLHRKKDGSLVQVSLTLSPVRDALGNVTSASVIARDVTEQKRLEKELLEISAAERRRIGHELHDGLGQYLAGVAFRAKALEEALVAEGSQHSPDAKELTAFVSNAISQTRRLAHGFDPIEVESSGLLAALQNLVAESIHLFDINCLFHCRDSKLSVDTRTGLALYRIAQEAIHNAVTHGAARQIDLELVVDGGHLCLRIRDDGIGFQTQTANQTGMGLRVMGYRARSIGAKLIMSSQPDRGTEIECAMPYPAANGSA